MANKISVLIDVTVDKAVGSLRNFRTSIADADGAVNKFKAGGKAAFDGIKANAGAMAVGAIGSVIAFSGSIIKAGGEMAAMDAKAETVFGQSLGRVKKWGDEHAGAMGLTTREATTAGTAIADLLKPMGFSEEAATDNALALLDLGGALSAWSGGQVSAAGVTEVFTKAMLGERDGLKALGISISEADVQTRLLQKGQEALTGAAMQQAKAVATQELIFEKSTDAQKAWADGSMDGVKAQNEAKSAVARLGEVLNESLYPVLVNLVPIIAETAEGLLPLAENLGTVMKVLPEVAAGLNLTASTGEKAWRSMEDLKGEFDAVGISGAEFAEISGKVQFGVIEMDEALQILADAQRENIDLTDRQANVSDDYRNAATIAAEATDDLGVSFTTVDRSAKDFADEVRRAEDELQSVKDAVLDADFALSKLKGNVDQREAWRNMRESLVELWLTTASGEATFDEMQIATDNASIAMADYIENAKNIPAEVKTSLYAELDRGNLDAVQLYIDKLQYGVEVPIRLKPGPGLSINGSGQVVGFGGRIIAGATGGIVTQPTMALIGEAGPEAVIPLNQAPGASPLPGGLGAGSSSGGGTTINITTNADPNSVVNATRRFSRRNGPGL